MCQKHHSGTDFEALAGSYERGNTQSDLRLRNGPLLLQREFWRPCHFRLELRPPGRHFASKPRFRSAPDFFRQMRAKRCDDRLCAMRVASAVGPLAILSDAVRKAVNEWYDNTLLSRLNNKRTGCIIIVMQRLHQDD